MADVDYANIWNRSFTSMSGNLAALRLVPYYLTMELQPLRNEVDARPTIEAMRNMTRAASKRHTTNHRHHVRGDLASERTLCDSEDPATCSGCRSFSNLLYSFTNAHVSTFKPRHEQPQCTGEWLPAAWRSLAAISIFYNNHVLQLWNHGQPVEPLLFPRLINALKSDIMDTESDATVVGIRNSLWLWKVAVGAHGVLATIMADDPRAYIRYMDLEQAKAWFLAWIRKWAVARGITEWGDVKRALEDIVWPSTETMSFYETLIWTEAINVDHQPSQHIAESVQPGYYKQDNH
jgi:hypothetical protein